MEKQLDRSSLFLCPIGPRGVKRGRRLAGCLSYSGMSADPTRKTVQDSSGNGALLSYKSDKEAGTTHFAGKKLGKLTD